MTARTEKLIQKACVAILFASIVCPILFVSEVEAALTQISVTVDSSKVVATSNSSFGFILRSDWRSFQSNAVPQQLAEDGGFKLITLWDKAVGPSDYRKGVGPCLYWYESTQTGKWDWTSVDSLVRAIFNVGAEPFILLSKWRDPNDPNGWESAFPPGMAISSTTLLPNPNSYAAFAASWVQHFKTLGLPVRYYGIIGEPQTYIGWSPPGDKVRIANFVKLFNAAYTKMHQVNSNVMVSTDCSLERHFFDYFLNYGVGIDNLDFHKYDGWKYPQYTDAQMFAMAEQKYFVTDYTAYSISDARRKWYAKHGKWLPAICSEGNFNAAYKDGSDPRIPTMAGAVRNAVFARMGMLNGMSQFQYFCFSTSASYERTLGTGAVGHGMINNDNWKPWYPYYLFQMLGNSLSPKDKILQTSVSSTQFRTIAWNHNGKINVLVISKSTQSYAVSVQGLQGTVTYQKIDQSISWTTPKVQTGQVAGSLTFNGYTVALFQSSSGGSGGGGGSSSLNDGFESGSFSAWTGTSTTSGETVTVSTTTRHHGTYSAKFTSSGDAGTEYAYCYKTMTASEIYARGYIYIASGLPLVDNGDTFYLIRLRAGTTSLAGVGISRNSGANSWIMYGRNGAATTISYASSPTILTGRWYCIESHWKRDASQGVMQLYINGAKILETTGLNTANYGSIDTVNFGLISATGVQNKLTVYGDCFAASSAYIGPE